MEVELKTTFVQEILKNVVSRCTPVLYQNHQKLKKKDNIYLIHILQVKTVKCGPPLWLCLEVDTRPKGCMSKFYL